MDKVISAKVLLAVAYQLFHEEAGWAKYKLSHSLSVNNEKLGNCCFYCITEEKRKYGKKEKKRFARQKKIRFMKMPIGLKVTDPNNPAND